LHNQLIFIFLRNYLYAFESVDDGSNGVADDEDDDDDEQHHGDGVIATLVR
jgi:hypothetical protein